MGSGRTPFLLVGAGCLVASLLVVWVSGDSYPPVTAWFQNALFFLGITSVGAGAVRIVLDERDRDARPPA